MRLQPNRNYKSDDVVQTPIEMAERVVRHFRPTGRILEPCCGEGNFLRFLPGADWCEISRGRDFLQWQEPVDWIITNPPWSQIRVFLNHAMRHADHVVFLMTINHIWTAARLRDLKNSGFAIKEICLLELPVTFPISGFQLGAIHVARGWAGPITLTDLAKPVSRSRKPLIRRGNLVKVRR
ncbi:MAG: hypothetical protein LBK71_05335 [Verrucomicrobiales bacterium]|jgi:hypothetical protein|nr:hypothetical protein [Verrucomicrobiales bacterium]